MKPMRDVRNRRAPGLLLARLIVAGGAALAMAVGLVVPPAAAADVPGSFTIDGSGYGHGVGMAQYGAYQMAREGSSVSQILGHYYTGSRTAYTGTPRTIDVQVYGPDPYRYAGYGDSGPTRISLDRGSWRLRARGETLARGTGPLAVSVSGGDVVVRTGGHTYRQARMWLQWSGTGAYRPDGTPAVVRVDGAHGSYRWGRLQLTASAGEPNVVNRLLLHSAYLYGLAEMPASWGANGGAAALEAQAVVARSFALVRMATWKSRCRCHVVDDVRDQHFTGYENLTSRYARHWTEAVRDTTATRTRARVLTYAGRPVEAHYFSSSGGRTAHSEDVWSSVVPYERSVADPYSLRAPGNGNARWGRLLTQDAAAKLFGLRRVASIKVTDRYRSGQAAALVATSPAGRTGTVSGSADAIRLEVGPHTRGGNLPSSWILRVRSN